LNTSTDTEPIDNELEDMDDSEDSNSDLVFQCIEIGKMLNRCILSDIVDVEAVSSIEEISNFNPLIWLAHRPPELIQLIYIDVNVASNKKLVILAKIVELIYYCCNSRKVLPNHFLENLLCYSFTNSKSHLSFLGSRSPGGSYSYVTSWLKDQSKDLIKYPSGLVKSVFDNSQKVGKTYAITGTNIVPTSVITSHLWITLDKSSDLQEQLKYKPGEWMWKEIDQETSSKLIELLTKPRENFRNTRNSFIGLCIDMVYKQHKTSLTDFIDSQIKANETSAKQKTCKVCNCEANVSFSHCHNCRGEVIKQTSLPDNVQIDPYESFQGAFSALPKISCQAGEPDFVNPNYQNIIQVIQAIGIRAGVKQYGNGSREWLMVECDGLPYNIIRDIIANVWRCSQCLGCFYGLDSFEEHKCYILKSIQPNREFAWLLPVSGLLHVEMNVARSFTRLNWVTF